jgi:hypothetical protein
MKAAAAPAEIEVTGRVERRLLQAGSKSEHHGIVLLTDDGQVWKLRRDGGPAFGDAALAELEGRTICATGRARDTLLLIRQWRVVAPG